MDLTEIRTVMLLAFFIIGILTFCIGVIILIFRTTGSDQKTIAAQAARLAQKGLAEEIAGLVGNASALLVALNDLVRTSAGIGIFLILIGFLQMTGSLWLVVTLSRTI